MVTPHVGKRPLNAGQCQLSSHKPPALQCAMPALLSARPERSSAPLTLTARWEDAQQAGCEAAEHAHAARDERAAPASAQVCAGLAHNPVVAHPNPSPPPESPETTSSDAQSDRQVCGRIPPYGVAPGRVAAAALWHRRRALLRSWPPSEPGDGPLDGLQHTHMHIHTCTYTHACPIYTYAHMHMHRSARLASAYTRTPRTTTSLSTPSSSSSLRTMRANLLRRCGSSAPRSTLPTAAARAPRVPSVHGSSTPLSRLSRSESHHQHIHARVCMLLFACPCPCAMCTMCACPLYNMYNTCPCIYAQHVRPCPWTAASTSRSPSSSGTRSRASVSPGARSLARTA